jgi:hypothetical protein
MKKIYICVLIYASMNYWREFKRLFAESSFSCFLQRSLGFDKIGILWRKKLYSSIWTKKSLESYQYDDDNTCLIVQ